MCCLLLLQLTNDKWLLLLKVAGHSIEAYMYIHACYSKLHCISHENLLKFISENISITEWSPKYFQPKIQNRVQVIFLFYVRSQWGWFYNFPHNITPACTSIDKQIWRHTLCICISHLLNNILDICRYWPIWQYCQNRMEIMLFLIGLYMNIMPVFG